MDCHRRVLLPRVRAAAAGAKRYSFVRQAKWESVTHDEDEAQPSPRARPTLHARRVAVTAFCWQDWPPHRRSSNRPHQETWPFRRRASGARLSIRRHPMRERTMRRSRSQSTALGQAATRAAGWRLDARVRQHRATAAARRTSGIARSEETSKVSSFGGTPSKSRRERPWARPRYTVKTATAAGRATTTRRRRWPRSRPTSTSHPTARWARRSASVQPGGCAERLLELAPRRL